MTERRRQNGTRPGKRLACPLPLEATANPWRTR